MNSFNAQMNNIPVNDYLFALQQKNLVYNSDFRYFSNQRIDGNNIVYGTPDGWVYSDEGTNGQITFNPDTFQLEITKSSGYDRMSFSQALHEFPRWENELKGKTITAKVVLKIVEGGVTVTLTDGYSSNKVSRYEKGDCEIQIKLDVDKSATSVSLSIESDVDSTSLHISSVFANVGSVALPNLPCIVQGVIGERKQYVSAEAPPAEEFSLTEASIELDSNFSRLSSVLNGKFGMGDNGYSLLPDMRDYFNRAKDNGASGNNDGSQNGGTQTKKITELYTIKWA